MCRERKEIVLAACYRLFIAAAACYCLAAIRLSFIVYVAPPLIRCRHVSPYLIYFATSFRHSDYLSLFSSRYNIRRHFSLRRFTFIHYFSMMSPRTTFSLLMAAARRGYTCPMMFIADIMFVATMRGP